MDRRGIIAAVIILILLGILGYFVYMNDAGSGSSSLQPTKQFSDPAYGYSFQYPAQETIQEDSPQYVIVGAIDGSNVNGIAEADVAFSQPSSTYTSFDSFVQAQAALYCDASGPGEDISCPVVQSDKPFATQSGLAGEELYFNEITTSTAGATLQSTTFGPVFAFDISGNTPQENAQFSALIIHPLISSTSTDPSTIEGMANTLQFTSTK